MDTRCCIEQILEAESEIKENIISLDSKAIALARIGFSD
jgi:diphthamide biosynthesis methyltransferase